MKTTFKNQFKKALAGILLAGTSFLIGPAAYGQAPQSMKYQGVARDNVGNELAYQSLGLRLSIVVGSPTGTSVYTETQNPTTNEFGLFNVKVGGGTLVSGNFTTIDWGSDSHYLKVEMDETGGTNYNLMGASELLSVPYALYAETSGDTTGKSVWTQKGDTIYYNAGNVGIGTTSPSSPLTVETITENAGILLNDGSGNERVHMAHNTGIGGYVQVRDLGNQITVLFRGSGGSYINSGNVGIGLTNPDAALHVGGDFKLVDGSEGAGKVLTSDGSGLASWQTPAATAPSDTSLFADSAGHAYNADNADTATYAWEAESADTATYSWEAENSDTADFAWNAVWEQNVDTIYYTGGNVGIGTSSPGTPLEVLKDSGSVHQDVIAMKATFADNENYVRSIVWKDEFDQRIAAIGSVWDGTSNNILFHSQYYGGENTEADVTMIVKGDGLVGIGTANPGAALDVAGDIKITDGTEGIGKVLTSDASGLATWQAPIGGADADWTMDGDTLYSAPDSSITIKGGNVGIGTTTPDKLLTLASAESKIRAYTISDSTNSSIAFMRANSGTTTVNYNDQIGSVVAQGYNGTTYNKAASIKFSIDSTPGFNDMPGRIDFYTTPDGTASQTKRMTINNAGDIGIGTASPSARLDVAGDIKITDGTEGLGKVLTSDATGLASWQTPAATVPSDTSLYADSAGYADTALFARNVLWDNTGDTIYYTQGRVGIGTSFPFYKLHVSGPVGFEAGFGGSIFLDNIATQLKIRSSSSGIYFENNAASSTLMRIMDGGNVGIGTTSPDTTLHIAGALKVVDGTQGAGKVLTSDAAGLASWQTPSGGADADWTIAGGDTIYHLNGNVGIGTATPSGTMELYRDGASNFIHHASSGSSFGSSFYFYRSRTGPAIVQNGDKLGVIGAFGWDGSSWASGATIQFLVDGVPGSLDMPGSILFRTTPDGGFSSLQRMIIDNQGNVGIGESTPVNLLHLTDGNTDIDASQLRIEANNPGTLTYAALEFRANPATASLLPVGRILAYNTSPGYTNAKMVLQTIGAGPSFYDAMTLQYENVGIGVSDPNDRLVVKSPGTGTSNLSIAVNRNGSTQDVFRVYEGPGSQGILTLNNSSETTQIELNAGGSSYLLGGFVGIGCSAPSYMLHVMGDIAAQGTLRAISATVSTTITACSDIRYKKNVVTLGSSLDNVLKMRGVNYHWRKNKFPEKQFTDEQQLGFIAQELELLYPEVVATDEDGYKAVDYGRLTPVLVEAIKEQQALIDAQRKELETLKAEVTEIKAIVGARASNE